MSEGTPEVVRRYPVRIYASTEVSAQIDEAMIDVMAATRFKVSKAEVSDALCAIGLRHMTEVAEYIKEKRNA